MPDPLIVDPALQAEVVRQFNLRGELSPFLLTNRVVPIFDIGSLTGNLPTVVTTLAGSQGVRVGTVSDVTALTVEPPSERVADVVDGRTVTNPTAGTVLVDSGQLQAGNHLFHALINCDAAIDDFSIEWRDAANAVTLASYGFYVGTGQPTVYWGPHLLAVATTNQRVRIITENTITGDARATVWSARVITSLAS